MIEREAKKLELGEEADSPEEHAQKIIEEANGVVVIGVKDSRVMSTSGGSMNGEELVNLIEALPVVHKDMLESIGDIVEQGEVPE